MDDFIVKFMSLRDGEDKCDKVGIKFIGNLLNYYCPDSANFKLLPTQI